MYVYYLFIYIFCLQCFPNAQFISNYNEMEQYNNINNKYCQKWFLAED